MVRIISFLYYNKTIVVFSFLGIVDFNEFLSAIALTMSGKNWLNSFILFVYIIGETRDRLDLAFSMYDINGDGLLDKKDIS